MARRTKLTDQERGALRILTLPETVQGLSHLALINAAVSVATARG